MSGRNINKKSKENWKGTMKWPKVRPSNSKPKALYVERIQATCTFT